MSAICLLDGESAAEMGVNFFVSQQKTNLCSQSTPETDDSIVIHLKNQKLWH
jgi:hypothetical protein